MIELREGLVDRIYEAAADSERWRSLLDEIAQLTRSRFGCLITGRSGECLALGPQEALAMLTEFRALRPRIPNPRLEFGLRATSPRFRTDEDCFDPHMLQTHPFYADFLAPRGYGRFAGVVLRDGAMLTSLRWERRLDDGPYTPDELDFFNALLPHLRRSLRMARNVVKSQAVGAGAVLEVFDQPAAVIDDSRAVIEGNELFASAGFAELGRLSLNHRAADEELARRIRLRVFDPVPIFVPQRGATPPMVVKVAPLTGVSHAVFSRSRFLVTLRQIDLAAPPAREALMALYNLSPAEVEVAQLLVQGLTTDRISAALGKSPETIRTQVKGVMAKAGANRQAKLAGLFAQITR